MNKPTRKKKPKFTYEETHMTMEEATTYLKKMGEWEFVSRLDRETILGWAEYLLVYEERKKYGDKKSE